MSLASRLRSFVAQVTRISAIAFFLSCLLAIAPVFAQDQPTAPIVVDGRRLFEVSQSGGFTAEGRAADANRLLRERIKRAETPLQVEVEQTGGGLPVIRVDGRHLLSVTAEDTPEGRSVQEQAQVWANELRRAVERAQQERTRTYIVRAIFLSVGYLGLAFAVSWGLGWLWQQWLKPRIEREPADSLQPQTSQHSLSTEIGAQIILTIVRGAVWLYAIISISRLFPYTRQWSHNIVDVVRASLFSDIFSLGDSSYSVLELLILIGLFVGLFIAARTIRKVLQSRVLVFTGLSRAAQESIALVANYAFIFIGAIVLLQLWGLDISSLTVFAGVLGVGIGLGIQGIAKEFVSGLVIMFERPIQVGDFVEVGESMGTVERISVRSTEIRTLDQVSIILPNSRFLDSEVINWSHHSSVSRLRLPVGVAYGSNLTTVRAALMEAAKEHADVLSEPSPRVFFTGFGDSSLDFDLFVWITEPRKQFQIKSDLYFRIEAIFRHRDVEIPFPQRDLHVRSGNLPVEISPDLVQSLAELSSSLAGWLKYQSNGSGANDDNQDRKAIETK